MARTDSDAERFNRIVVWSLAVTAVLLLVLPMFFVLSNETYYSAYVEGGDTDEEKFAQLSTMRSTLMENLDKGNGEVSLGYDVANTISTPMLVNDWRDPHRSMLVIGRPWARNYFSEPLVLRKVPKVCFGGKIKRHAELMIYIGDGRRRLEMIGKARILRQSIGF